MTFNAILVGIGANLPSAMGLSPLQTCEWAARQLSSIRGMRLCRLSRWYETQPMPASDQPSFINGVAHLSGTADPHAVLEGLNRIEAAAGRVRGAPNAARALDLDLLAMGDAVLDSPTLTLPHPRIQERAFVLVPLADIMPGWQHPVLRLSAAQMLAALPDQGVRAL